ncbi:ras association domain-containing protein 4 [Cimex lectularius]|uniref:Ras association domain-containing protein 2 n=1 Tax=Cimex lectularius TaxID=79782 RepID=A0A8I6SIR0_CIMLE|nr:ras association domain-containing protein 4 [Cimex lectularius]
MWKCHKCGKPVYFAERKQSLGYDWHPECLRCEECGKRLNPGQHAEHKGVPYCHVPCYGALFGPQLYGHGTRVESHTSFGKVENKSAAKNMPRSHLESKLKVFNQYYDGKSGEIRCREVNGRLVLEGALRIYWGVSGVIHLKEDVDQRTVVTVRKRNSYRYSGVNGFGPKAESYENGSTTPNEQNNAELKNGSTAASSPMAGEDDSQNLTGKSLTLPSKLDLKNLEWNEIDDLLQVERRVEDGEKLYRTMPSSLPSAGRPASLETANSEEGDRTVDSTPSTPSSSDPFYTDRDPYSDSLDNTLEGRGLDESEPRPRSFDRSQSNPENLTASAGLTDSEEESTRSEVTVVRRRRRGDAAIRRRPGAIRRRRAGAKLRRRCSINGHFYNRETSFFTPPFGSQMSVWVTSLVSTQEVINLMLDKYKVDSKPDFFALFIVRDNGEQRMLKEDEYPLLTRVMLGPHEDVAKLYLMDRTTTEEISPEVAQFLNLSMFECNAILEQYNTEQAREERRIQAKFREMKKRIKQCMEDLKVRL